MIRTRIRVLMYETAEDLRELQRLLAHQAFHDPLTNLANRLLLADRLEHALGRQRRTDESVAALFLRPGRLQDGK